MLKLMYRTRILVVNLDKAAVRITEKTFRQESDLMEKQVYQKILLGLALISMVTMRARILL